MNNLVKVKIEPEESMYVPLGITVDGLVVLVKPNVINKNFVEDKDVKFLEVYEITSYKRTTHEVYLKDYKVWYLKQQLAKGYPILKIDNDSIEDYLAKTYNEINVGEIYKISTASGWYILKLNTCGNHIALSDNVYQVLKSIEDKQYFIDMYIKDNENLFNGVFNGDVYYKCMDIDFRYNLGEFF